MWPLTVLRKRKYERHFNAALIVFLGAYLFDTLDAVDKGRVEKLLTENMKRSADPPVAWLRWYPWWKIAAFRAAAMQMAGIKLPMPSYSWDHLFRSWQRWSWFNPVPPFLKGFDARPLFVLLDFRPMSEATSNAKSLLREYGLKIPDEDPAEFRPLEP